MSKITKKPGTIRVRECQLEILVKAMAENPFLRGIKLNNKYTCQDRQKDWDELARKLNSCGGAFKSVSEWQKTWSDKKSLTKVKYRKYKTEISKTGGGTVNPTKNLTPLEWRILDTIGEDCLDGFPNNEGESPMDILPASESFSYQESEEPCLVSAPDSRELQGNNSQERNEPFLTSTPIRQLNRQETDDPEEASVTGLPDNQDIEARRPKASAEPKLRSFRKRVRAKNFVVRPSNANLLCEGVTGMSQALVQFAASMEKSVEVETRKAEAMERANLIKERAEEEKRLFRVGKGVTGMSQALVQFAASMEKSVEVETRKAEAMERANLIKERAEEEKRQFRVAMLELQKNQISAIKSLADLLKK